MKNKIAVRQFIPWYWHGFFLAITMAMMELNTILPGLISELTDNKIVFGALYSVLLGAPLLFNLPMSRIMRAFKKRRIFLLVGIYARMLALFGIALVVYYVAGKHGTSALFWVFVLVFLFAVSGGLAGTAYSDLVGRTFSVKERGTIFAGRQFLMGLGSLGGGAFVAWLLKSSTLGIWNRYALLFLIGAGGLFLAAVGFWAVKEENATTYETITEANTAKQKLQKTEPAIEAKPFLPDRETKQESQTAKREGMFREAWTTLKQDPRYARFILVENITSFSLMILPFYLVYAKQTFAQFQDYFGLYVLLQIIGGLSSNFFWGFISSKTGNSPVIRLCILFGAFLPIFALVAAQVGPVLYAVVFFFIGVVTSGRSIGFEPYLLEIAPDEKRTLYIGLRGTLSLMDVLLPLVGGILIQFTGFIPAFVLVTLMMLLSLVLFRDKKPGTTLS